MLLANPHQPWFGFGQLYEAHLRSGDEWNFTGATFYGSPMPTIGHNEDVGWSFTVNEPDIADVWRETFDDPADPLKYRYDGGYRRAVQWQDTISIRQGTGLKDKTYTFRKTHHGPIVAKEGKVHLAAQVAKLYDTMLLRQMHILVRAKNVDDFKRGMGTLNFPIMNAIYADRHGDIFYLYNGTIPRRDAQFDWSKPVDGSDPRTEWQGYHSIDELPQVLNPKSGFVQNCNSSPFTVTDVGNPSLGDFPRYMAEDQDDDKRRAKISRQILREMHDVTLQDVEHAAFDTTLYWAQVELPRYARALEELKTTDEKLAERVAPYLAHLLEWDYRVTQQSTQAPLCVAWYEELYGGSYPGEILKPAYQGNVPLQLAALVQAAANLQTTYGSWKVPYGEIYRIQRHADVAELVDIPFDDAQPSLPSIGSHGPMGVIFTQYYTPVIQIPFVKSIKKHYGVVGLTYLGVFEFGDKVRGGTLVQFGESGDPRSPHFFDQAQLLSECKTKPELFDWDEIKTMCRAPIILAKRPRKRHGSRCPAGRENEKGSLAQERTQGKNPCEDSGAQQRTLRTSSGYLERPPRQLSRIRRWLRRRQRSVFRFVPVAAVFLAGVIAQPHVRIAPRVGTVPVQIVVRAVQLLLGRRQDIAEDHTIQLPVR